MVCIRLAVPCSAWMTPCRRCALPRLGMTTAILTRPSKACPPGSRLRGPCRSPSGLCRGGSWFAFDGRNQDRHTRIVLDMPVGQHLLAQHLAADLGLVL